MKTLPLSEVIASAAPLPYRIAKHDSLRRVRHIDAGPAGYERTTVAILDGKESEANAALLAHAANMLPELVEALQSLLDTAERFRDDLESLEGYTEKPESLKRATETLSRARSVPMP